MHTKFIIAAAVSALAASASAAPLGTPYALSAVHADFQAQLARDDRLVSLIMEIKWIRTIAARDFENVAEAGTRHQRRLGALTLDEGINDERRAVVDQTHVGGAELGLGETF